MDILGWLEVGLAVFVIISGQAVLWVKFKTLVEVKVQNLEDVTKRHEECIGNIKAKSNEAITMPQHEKIQSDCQRGIYNDIDNITRSVDELRADLKGTDKSVNSISVAIAGLRADLTHIGVVK